MKHKLLSVTLASGLCLGSVAVSAESQSMMKLAEEKQCMACHTTSDELPRAPSFPSIAQRYTKADSERLVGVVLTGGEDHWGSAEMPEPAARVEVNEEEAKKLVGWILDMRAETE